MNFQEVFLKLTEFTTPFGHERTLEEILKAFVPGIKRDAIGNYHITVGKSQTLFSSHLDNYCKLSEKVNHIIDGNIIKTDETTILGADNKAGVLVLLYLISNNVPGHYYFFIGEEPILSGGLHGSRMLCVHLRDRLAGIKRAVAFDRREYGSIITRQSAQPCCSAEFTMALIKEFANQEIEMSPDPTGYYTDTASFLEIIPECTNISVGVFGEHSKKESVDITYVEAIAKAAAKINWEELPTSRNPVYWLPTDEDVEIRETEGDYDIMIDNQRCFKIITEYLSAYNFKLMNKTSFTSGKKMIFNHWFRDFKLVVTVNKCITRVYDQIIDIDFFNDEDPIDYEQLKNAIIACKEYVYK
jgi:hypothetical protein